MVESGTEGGTGGQQLMEDFSALGRCCLTIHIEPLGTLSRPRNQTLRSQAFDPSKPPDWFRSGPLGPQGRPGFVLFTEGRSWSPFGVGELGIPGLPLDRPHQRNDLPGRSVFCVPGASCSLGSGHTCTAVILLLCAGKRSTGGFLLRCTQSLASMRQIVRSSPARLHVRSDSQCSSQDVGPSRFWESWVPDSTGKAGRV